MLNGNEIIARDQCPRCRSNGRDNSKDNLAVYADGHEWCYACSYHRPAKLEQRIEKLITTITPETNKAPETIALPPDTSLSLPEEVISRLLAWNLTFNQIKIHNFMWSEDRKSLIMPVYDGYGQLLMYQERSWDIGKRKYMTYGKPTDILHIITNNPLNKDTIILTEDLVSAIRVSEYKPAMPLWGSDIPLQTIRRLASRFNTVGVWLDPDMKQKAVRDVLRISQYVPCFFVESSMDPKFYPIDRIMEHIDISGYHMFYKDKPTIITDHDKEIT